MSQGFRRSAVSFFIPIFLIISSFVLAESNPPSRADTFFEANKFRKIENLKNTNGVLKTEAMNRYLNERLSGHKESRGFALVVGINKSGMAELGFDDLKKPKEEAETMGNILSQNGYNVRMLVEKQATKKNILNTLAFFSSPESSANSRILFYFSGHGTTYRHVHGKINKHVRESIEKANENRYGHLKGISKPLYDDRLWKSFYMIPYQEKNASDLLANGDISLVGDNDIMDILAKSKATEKIIMIDACMAREKDGIVYNPVPAYSHELQRQGYMYLSTSKKINKDGEFSPMIFDGLRCEADMIGNRDGVVSMFELINYIDLEWNAILGEEGVRDNKIKYIIYGSSDIPLAVALKNKEGCP